MARLRNIALGTGAAVATLAATACGPIAIGLGLGSIAENNETIITQLVLLNSNGLPISVNVQGVQPDGNAIFVNNITIDAGGIAEVGLPQAASLRVVGCEDLPVTAARRAPVMWDFAIGAPGTQSTATFAVESLVCGDLRSTATEPERVQFHRLDSNAQQTEFKFTQLASTKLDVDPSSTTLHPSGSYFYAITDLGGGMGEIRAYRRDSGTDALELIVPEYNSTPTNPVLFTYGTDISAVELVAEPLGRFAYLVDGNSTASRTNIEVYAIEGDGTLKPGVSMIRGLMSSLVFRPNGEFAYVYEDFGTSGEFVSFMIDDTNGAFVLVNQTTQSCLNTASPVLAVHPSASFAYTAVQATSPTEVKIGTFFLSAIGQIELLDQKCSEFERIFDLTIDPAGQFLYVTGERTSTQGGGDAVIRYPIDVATGALGPIDLSQTISDLSNVTSGSDPSLAASNAFKNIVYVATGDTLIPNSRDAMTGVLTPTPGGAMLPFGSPSSTRLVTEARSGRAYVSSN